MRIFADKKTIKQILNSKTEAHSYPLWTVGERAKKVNIQVMELCLKFEKQVAV